MSEKPRSGANAAAGSGSAMPWHQPGKWLVNPAYWDAEVEAERAAAPKRVHFIGCTLSEGDDCVGHQPNWNTRLGMIERLDASRRGRDHDAEPRDLRPSA